MSALSDKSREELISMNSELKAEINSLKEEIFSLKTEFNEYKNESKKWMSKKRMKSSGSEAMNKKLCLRSNALNRQSFSDRICDDLCEEILQYLSLEDKLKLEGVSKQFQRTVLKKHYELKIGAEFISKRKAKKQYKYHIRSISKSKKSNPFYLKSLEVLLKKCPNITSILFRKPYFKFDYNKVFPLITKYCNNLREIDFGENKINDKNIKEFQRKFGPKIKFIHRLKDANNYNLFPNILNLKIDDNYSDLKEVIPRLQFNKLLTKLELTLNKGEEDMVKTCVEAFPTLTHFEIINLSENKNAIYNSLEFISNLKHLIEFRSEGSAENNKQLCVSLKRMAKMCPKVKSIEWRFDITSDNSNLRQILSPFEAFPALKRFNLSLNFINFEYGHFDIRQMFSFEAFKCLSNITHLTLHFCEDENQIENLSYILKDIDIYLPQLKYFEFIVQIKATPEEVTQMADILSRLSRLQTLKLLFAFNVKYKKIGAKIRENCSEIRTIDTKYNNWFHDWNNS